VTFLRLLVYELALAPGHRPQILLPALSRSVSHTFPLNPETHHQVDFGDLKPPNGLQPRVLGCRPRLSSTARPHQTSSSRLHSKPFKASSLSIEYHEETIQENKEQGQGSPAAAIAPKRAHVHSTIAARQPGRTVYSRAWHVNRVSHCSRFKRAGNCADAKCSDEP